MAKKHRHRPARRSSNSGHRARKPAAKPACRVSQRDQQLIAFVGWHREHGILPERPVLEQLTAFFTVYDEISGGAPVTSMEPGLIAEFVEVLNERDADFASFFCLSLFEYLHFLRHTGRWSGGDENHLVLHRFLYRGVLNENVPP